MTKPKRTSARELSVQELPIVRRKCLKCNRGFDAFGRFYRLCPTCRLIPPPATGLSFGVV